MNRAVLFMPTIILVLILAACSNNSTASDGDIQTPLPTTQQIVSQAPTQTVPSRDNSTQDAPASSVEQTASVAPSDDIETIKTLDDAMKWYMRKIESNKYLTGTHFAFSYRILDTIEETDTITVYAHTLCEWVSADGESVSGGAGLSSITFQHADDTHSYIKHFDYVIPEGDEIPQKVLDIESDGSFFDGMREEVDKAIADLLNFD